MRFGWQSLLVMVLVLQVGGCGLFKGKSDDVPSKTRDALEVPPDLARPGGDDLAQGAPSATSYSEITAKAKPPSAAVPSAPSAASAPATVPAVSAAASPVRLERAGAQRWIVVNEPADQVWVRTRDYFVVNKIKLTTENQQTGILETDWSDRPYVIGEGMVAKVLGGLHSTGLRDRFRVRIEAGRNPGTSEIYVTHQGLEEVVASGGLSTVIQTVWQPRAADPEQEADLLYRLMRHFGVSEEQAKTQLAAGGSERAVRSKGLLTLKQEDFDNAWRRVGIALDRGRIVVEDRDRAAGIYYVRFVDGGESKRGGLFGWLRSDSSAESDKNSKAPTDRYQVLVKTSAGDTGVTVRNVKGEPEESPAAERLLDVLQNFLR